MRLRLLCLVGLAGAAIPALADYCPTAVSWRSWTVSSSEDRFMGAKYGDRYNLRNLFDRDAKTAWVFEQVKTDAPTDWWGGKYVLQIENQKGVVIDGIRLIGGYAKSQDVFQRNNRVRKIEVYARLKNADDWKPKKIAEAGLKDTDGWQTIKIPRANYTAVRLVVKSFYPGQDRDFALSELMLERDGQDVMNTLPKAMLYTKGDECGCGIQYAVIDHKAHVLGRTAPETLVDQFVSKNNRFCVAVTPGEKESRALVIDLEKGVIEKTLRLHGMYYSVDWQSARSFRLYSDGPNPPKPLIIRF